MIAPNFERQWDMPEPAEPESRVSQQLPSIHQSILANMENHVWVELPEAAPEPQLAVENESIVTPDSVAARKRQDSDRRETLLTELQALAEAPPIPPNENEFENDRDPGDESPPVRFQRLDVQPVVEHYRRCEACNGSGKRWMLLTCRRCGGLGSVKVGR